MTVSNSSIVDSINISVDQLLALRHNTTPATRNAPVSNGAWLGNFRSKKRGHGSDYDDLRPYSPGDDIRHIDWRASARMQQLHTRLYREEKEHRTTVVCDLRHCMFTGSDSLRANRAIQLAAQLLWQTSSKGTKLTLLIISATGIYIIEPASAEITTIRGCNALVKIHEHSVNLLSTNDSSNTIASPDASASSPSAGVSSHAIEFAPAMKIRHHRFESVDPFLGPTLDTVLRFLISRAEDKSTLVWISGMDNMGKQFYDTLGSSTLRRTHAFIHVSDPLLEQALPPGDYHYQQYSLTHNTFNTQFRSARLNRHTRKTLKEKLAHTLQERIEQFDALKIPYLTSAAGDTDVITALRYQGIIP